MGDAFSTLVVLHTADGMFAAPIHAAVMPDGRVFMLGQGAATYPTTPGDEGHMHFVMTPDPVGATLPATAVETDLMAPIDADHLVLNGHLYDDSLVCGGHTFLSDGRLMITSGTRTVKDAATGKLQLAYGGAYATAYDGTSWTRLPGNFSGVGTKNTGRWYPTLTRLADGRVLITGGYDVLVPAFYANLSEEIYDPAAGTYTTVSTQAQTPFAAHDADYTAVFQLPTAASGSNVLMIGEDGLPLYLNTATTPRRLAVEQRLPTGRLGALEVQQRRRHGDAPDPPHRRAVGLPQRFGAHDEREARHLGHGPGRRVRPGHQRLDPQHRHRHPSALPRTGAAARRPGAPDQRARRRGEQRGAHPQYIDPADNFSVSTSPANGVEVRGYHNVAVLLPDGRVMVSGGRYVDRATSSEKPDYAYFSPPT